MNSTTNRFGVAPIVDDDNVEYMFESLDGSGSKIHVELYAKKVWIVVCQNLVDIVPSSKIGENSENTSTSTSVQLGENILSGSLNRSLYMSCMDNEGNLRGSSEFRDDDIPYYRSFGDSSMVISMQDNSDLHNPTELKNMIVFN